jgi:hypothetical protein
MLGPSTPKGLLASRLVEKWSEPLGENRRRTL